ncbi:hypothetical protein BZG01_14585, partial [Labilibaculum manganireducens]
KYLFNGYNYTLFIILFFNNVSISQSITPSQAQTFQRNQTEFNNLANDVDRRLGMEFVDFTGDLFWNKTWEMGEIVTKSNILIDSIELKYCVLNQEFHVVKSDDTIAITNTDLINFIKIQNTLFIYCKSEVNNKIKTNCFEVLYDGKIKLLKNHTCVFVKGVKNVSSFVNPTSDHYEIRSTLFMKTPDNYAIKLPTSKNKFLKTIDTNNLKISSFIKTNKIHFNNENELIQLFSFYNKIYN